MEQGVEDTTFRSDEQSPARLSETFPSTAAYEPVLVMEADKRDRSKRKKYIKKALEDGVILGLLLSVVIPGAMYMNPIYILVSCIISLVTLVAVVLFFNENFDLRKNNTKWLAEALCSRWRKAEDGKEEETDKKSKKSKEGTFMERMRVLMTMHRRHVTYEGLQLGLSLFSCFQWIYYSYNSSFSWVDQEWTYPDQEFLSVFFEIFFAWDFFFRLLLARHRFRFMMSPYTLTDYLSFAPWIWAVVQMDIFVRADLGFLGPRSSWFVKGSLRFLRLIRVVKLLQELPTTSTLQAVRNQLGAIVIMLLCIVFGYAGIMFSLEYQYVGKENLVIINNLCSGVPLATEQRCQLSSENDFQSYHTVVYYAIVTISTVGYGDISPQTFEGRLVTVLMIVIALIVVPMHSSNLVDLMRESSEYIGPFTPDDDHAYVAVYTNEEPGAIVAFLQEFFHTDHEASESIKVLLLAEHLPPKELIKAFHLPQFQHRVHYRVLANASDQRTLQSLGFEDISSCFVLARKATQNPDAEDHLIMDVAMSIKGFYPSVRMFVEIVYRKNEVFLYSVLERGRDIVLCEDYVNQMMLAGNSLCRGFSTIIHNLIRTTLFDEPDMEKTKGTLELSVWEEEYLDGSEFEMYRIVFREHVFGHTVAEIAKEYYQQYEVVIVAVLSPEYGLVANPAFSIITSGCIGFVIADSQAVADAAASGVLPDILKGKVKGTFRLEKSTVAPISAEGSDSHQQQNSPRHRHRAGRSGLFENFENLTKSVAENPSTTHFLICGYGSGTRYLVELLRQVYVGTAKPIVILHQSELPDEDKAMMAEMGNIFYVKGSRTSLFHLNLANAAEADRVFVVKDSSEDSESINCFNALLSICPAARIIVELARSDTIRELIGGQLTYLTPWYASGTVHVARFSDKLLIQSFFNGDVSTLVEQLLFRPLPDSGKVQCQGLYEAALPTSCVGETYNSVFQYFILRGMVPIAIVRQTARSEMAWKDNGVAARRVHPLRQGNFSYVYTNPPKDFVVNSRDTAVVLGVSDVENIVPCAKPLVVVPKHHWTPITSEYELHRMDSDLLRMTRKFSSVSKRESPTLPPIQDSHGDPPLPHAPHALEGMGLES